MAKKNNRNSSKDKNSRSKSSGRWLQEHFNDPYVKQAQKEGYRSRACYKLMEIDQKDSLLKQGMTVVDLGSAPGGWCQVVADLVGSRGRVVASDILPMDSLAGVEFIQGDFTDDGIFEQILQALDNQAADLVISDMAPNMSGLKAVDQPRAMYLVELAVDLATRVLKPGGGFVAKAFHGEGFEEILSQLRKEFSSVRIRKPEASRPRSREVYLVATDYRSAD